MQYNIFNKSLFYDPFIKNNEEYFGTGKNGWTLYRDYDIICNFLEQKIKEDIKDCEVNSYLIKRGVRRMTITIGDTCLELILELGYVEFCNIEYNYTLASMIRLINAIKYYFDKYKKNSNAYIYLQRPSPVC